jgi:hypothetical protein
MRPILSVISFMAAGTLFGCGGQGVVMESAVPATSEHHAGILIPMTDKQAYVELLNGERVKKGEGYETTLIAYLLEPDQKTSFPETPKSVEVKMATAKGEQVVALKPAPDSADPLGATRFVSAPGPFELAESGGEVTVQVGGKTLSGKFRGPR